jgi:hypothetical protein
MQITIETGIKGRGETHSLRAAAAAIGHDFAAFEPEMGIPTKRLKSDLVAVYRMPSVPVNAYRSETGFFSGAMHFDRRGLWERSSFHDDAAMDEVRAYQPPSEADAVLAAMRANGSKYKQPKHDYEWHGVVLAAQKENDKSVRFVYDVKWRDKFWPFVEAACKRYGKDLLIKMHPKLDGTQILPFMNVAKRHKCQCEAVNLSVFDKCRFALVFNSTVAVDCWLRGIPVVQYAPGYFSHTGAVTFTNGTFVDEPGDTKDMARKMLDFLAWRYCFRQDMDNREFVAMLVEMAKAPKDVTFPMPERYSYGAQVLKAIRRLQAQQGTHIPQSEVA